MKLAGSLQTFIKLSSKVSAASSTQCGPIASPKSQTKFISNRTYYRDITEEMQDGITATPSSIRTFLNHQGIPLQGGHTCIKAKCSDSRNCGKSPRNAENIFINNTTGSFICTDCMWTGTWNKFQNTMLARKESSSFQSGIILEELSTANTWSTIYADAEAELSSTVSLDELSEGEFEELLRIYRISGVSRETFEKFGVRVYANKQDLFFPRFHVAKDRLTGYKKMIVRHRPEETVITEQIFPREGGVLGLFGWNLVLDESKEIILTSNEFDAMVIRQETGKDAVSLPRGTSVLPVDALPLLEQFDKVTLWLNGGGNRAWQAGKLFSRKLSEKRSFVVSPETVATGALPAFVAGGTKLLLHALEKAKPVAHKSIVTFGSFRQEVFNELSNMEESNGVRWQRFPMLNRIMKGHRKGELTVLTGPTGAGKTTFLSEYSIDLCSSGLRTLWGSFEIRNSRLAKTMLNQYSKKSIQKHIQEFDFWADKFEQLALYFMAFHGQEHMENVLEAMKHAVYVHDIEHIVLDNLQFMMGALRFRNMHDRIVRQDQMIEEFRRFATTYNCHVTLVVHPRKEMEGAELTAQSIYGGVKASQEADNILILQSNRGKSGLLQGKKYIQVVKNRFDGELGLVPLYFDKDSQSFMRKDKGHPGGEQPEEPKTENPSAERRRKPSTNFGEQNPFENLVDLKELSSR